jgi:hypothetical protein
MIIISILSCVWWIFLPHIRSAIKNNQIQSGKKFHPVIYSLLAVSAFLFMTFYDGILTLIYNGFKELINPSANPVLSGPILSDPSRFVLYLNVDYLLPLFLLVPLAMLWFAMWYASPVSASTPFPASTSSTSRREHIYAMVHSDFPA